MTLELPELRTIDLDGPVAYREWEGPADVTFVMVHGLGGSHLSWIQAAPGLAGLGRVVALDLPGFGWSPRAGRSTELMAERQVLSRVMDKLGSGRVILCGNSMGGALAVLQAAVEPGSVDALVLTGSVFPWIREGGISGRVFGGLPHPAIVASFTAYRTRWLGEGLVNARARFVPPEHAVRLAFHYVTADPRTIPEDVIDLHVELLAQRQSDPESTPAFLDAARSLLRLGSRPEVARRALDHVDQPVLVLHGRRDRLVPPAFAAAELRRHSTWRGRFFPDLGHVPQMEAPGRWISEVADWYPGALG